jgi:hypothetical protein
MSQFQVGDEVEIIDEGFLYTIYKEMALKLGATKYESGFGFQTCLNGIKGTVVNSFKGEGEYITYVLVDIGTKEILIGTDGLKLISRKEDKMFKVGDRVRIKGEEDILGTVIENDFAFENSEYVKTTSGQKFHYNRVKIEKIGDSPMSLKDRIKAISGNSTLQEVDDILQDLKDGYRIEIDYVFGKSQTSVIKVWYKNISAIQIFPFTSQCSKLTALKQALLRLLERSGAKEKEKDKEKIAELRKDISRIQAELDRLEKKEA